MPMIKNHPQKSPLLEVRDLKVRFRVGRSNMIHAVSGVSFDIHSGETLGLVGESGCGKSTVARCIVRLKDATSGGMRYNGEDLSRLKGERLRMIRPQIQMIFQDVMAALNPGRKIGKTIEEPLRVLGLSDRQARFRQANEMMKSVGLDPEKMYNRYPFELSGGQCQRVSIARALIMKPRLLICDEPASSLDVSVQAQILNLLEKMKLEFDLTILFISHDLAVVKNISDLVAVMYMGKLCEIAGAEELYQAPHHPYTEALLDAIPEPDPDLGSKALNQSNAGLPFPISPPSGCRFHPRCSLSRDRCREIEPTLLPIGNNRKVACHYPINRERA